VGKVKSKMPFEYFDATLSLTLILSISFISLSYAQITTAVSGFSSTHYTPTVPLGVTITVNPATTVNVYAVEDTPPDGWTVSDINEGGNWDAVNKKVKWGPFFDHNQRALSYTVTAPADAIGSKTFEGIASFDGVDMTIAGDRMISTSATLTVSSSTGGSVTTPGEDTYTYDYGTVVDIVAATDANYHFVNWTGTGVDAGKVANSDVESTNITMHGNYTVIANFAIDTFLVTASVSGGHGIVSPTSQIVDYNGTATINITPNSRYYIASITDNGESVSITNPYVISNVTAAHTVVVTFQSDTPLLSTAYWRFEEGENSTAADSSGNGHDGTLQGGITWTSQSAPKNGGDWALQFDGVDGCVVVPSHQDFYLLSFTLQGWIKTTAETGRILFKQAMPAQNLFEIFIDQGKVCGGVVGADSSQYSRVTSSTSIND